MKLKGGYNALLESRPSPIVQRLPEPKELYLPLYSRRFLFDEICVEDGQQVNAGDVVAKDPINFALPLLAPRGGTVRLKTVNNHIVLTDIFPPDKKVYVPEKYSHHIVRKVGTIGINRYKLLSFGAWEFFYDAHTGQLPDPLGTPQAVIVSTLSLEPFLARGDVQLHNRLLNFTRGLEQLQSLLEYQPIYLVVPDIKSDFANLVRNQIRGYAWAKMIEVPLTYPRDNFVILAREIGLKKSKGTVWALRTEGVLAVDRALTLSKPCLVRIVPIGGTGVNSPNHLKLIPGYPIKKIIDEYVFEPNARIIEGGVFTGKQLDKGKHGIDNECRGLTVIAEQQEREFLGFMRFGWNRSSYSNCFLSTLRKPFREKLTTGLHGEKRPCISCNYCEEICPAGIMPHFIHKYLYADLIEDAEQARLDLCVECGLCAFVCPSKIPLTGEFINAKVIIAKEKEEIRLEQERQKSLEEKIS